MITRRGERGAATAELAMALPLLIAVTSGWSGCWRSARPRCGPSTPPARPPARWPAATTTAAAVARGQRVAPDGSRVTVPDGGGEVTVVVVRRVPTARRAVRVPAARSGCTPRRSRRARRIRRERAAGRASAARRRLFAVACLSVLLLVGAALGVVAAMVHAHRVAQSAADLAALAAASAVGRGGDACAAAGRIAAANGAGLDGVPGVRPRGRGHASGRRAALAGPDRRPRRRGAGGAGVSGGSGAVAAVVARVRVLAALGLDALELLRELARAACSRGAARRLRLVPHLLIEKPHRIATPAPRPMRKIAVP